MVIARKLISDVNDLPVTLAGQEWSARIIHPDGFKEKLRASLVMFATVKGFRAGLVDYTGHVQYVGSETLHMSPRTAVLGMWLLGGLHELALVGDDEIKVFNDFSLAFAGYLDERGVDELANSLCIRPSLLRGMMTHFVSGKEFDYMVELYSGGDNRMFREAVATMMPYLCAYGDIHPEETGWLQSIGVIAPNVLQLC